MPGNHYTFNFSLWDDITAVLAFCLLVRGGGLLVKIRRQLQQIGNVDPEAIELRQIRGGARLNDTGNKATGAMEGSAALNTGNDAVPKASAAVGGRVVFDAGNDAGTEATGTVEVSVTLDAGNDADPDAVEVGVTGTVDSGDTLSTGDDANASD